MMFLSGDKSFFKSQNNHLWYCTGAEKVSYDVYDIYVMHGIIRSTSLMIPNNPNYISC